MRVAVVKNGVVVNVIEVRKLEDYKPPKDCTIVENPELEIGDIL